MFVKKIVSGVIILAIYVDDIAATASNVNGMKTLKTNLVKRFHEGAGRT